MAYDYFSDQVTNMDAVPVVKNAPYDKGKVQCMFFSYTVPTGNIATSKTIELLRLPKGARIISGVLANTAMSSGGGDSSVQLGDGTTADKYLATTSVDAAGLRAFYATAALKYGELLTVDTSLVATVITEAWIAAGVLSGHVLYVKD